MIKSPANPFTPVWAKNAGTLHKPIIIPSSNLQMGEDYFIRFDYLLSFCEIGHISFVVDTARVKTCACLFGRTP